MTIRERQRESRQKALADASAGVVAALISLWAFYPFDVWKTNVQAGGSLTDLPLGRFFAGWQVKTLHTASSSFFYFYLYSWIVSWWSNTFHESGTKPKLSAPTRLALSAVAAMLNTLITLPLDVISAQHQTESRSLEERRRALDKLYESAIEEEVGEEKKDDALNATNEEKSTTISLPSKFQKLKGLWKGLNPSLLLCSNPAINYTVFDSLKATLMDRRSKSSLSMGEAFVLGIFAKFAATMATYPLIRAKVMLMVTSKRSLIWCLVDEYRKEGIQGLYKGCHLQLLHTLLKSALLMMMRERITNTTYRLMLRENKDLH